MTLSVTAQNTVIVTFSESVERFTNDDVTIEIPEVSTFTYTVSKISAVVYEIEIFATVNAGTKARISFRKTVTDKY